MDLTQRPEDAKLRKDAIELLYGFFRLNHQLIQRDHCRQAFVLKAAFARRVYASLTRCAFLSARAADVTFFVRD